MHCIKVSLQRPIPHTALPTYLFIYYYFPHFFSLVGLLISNFTRVIWQTRELISLDNEVTPSVINSCPGRTMIWQR